LRSAGKPADPEFGPGSLAGRGIVFDHEYLEIFQDTVEPPRLLYPKLLSKKRLVVLVRDPRSVCVSYYFHKKLRDRLQVGGLADFVKSPMFGIERQSAFINLILDLYDDKKGDKLLLRYEDLLAHPAREFGRFTKFVLPHEDNSKFASQALELSSFDRMQKREIKQSIEPREEASEIRSGVRNWDGNLDALKTRKADPDEARSIFTQSLWNEISGLAETRRVLSRLNYPRY
jgi:Sulfotransferase domain.